ncbi:CD82 antigen [Aplysia californica]|uniref:CD82 antigen n=1 Tax=Aplysia californica TaxID=6500 RepID=A0ABM1A174_APLCA|nr:CD82 antigen [Aplysia californica]
MASSLNSSYGQESQQEVTDAWDIMQSFFDCCGVVGGVNSTTSWAYYKYYTAWFYNQTEPKEYVPDSCCRNAFGLNRTRCVGAYGFDHMIPHLGPPVGATQENDNLFTEGCYTAVIDFLAENVRIFAGLAAGVGVLMIMGMVFAICLCRRIKDDFLFD